MKLKIGNNYYLIDEGFTITENYNETLDSASVRVSQLNSRIENLEPLDRADIYTDNNVLSRTFCIDTWTETQTSINPAIYDYEFSLVSETKLLEGIVLPNRSITIPRGQNAKSIYYYLNQYLDLYNERKRGIVTSDTFIDNYGFFISGVGSESAALIYQRAFALIDKPQNITNTSVLVAIIDTYSGEAVKTYIEVEPSQFNYNIVGDIVTYDFNMLLSTLCYDKLGYSRSITMDELRNIVSHYMTLSVEIIFNYDGWVKQFSYSQNVQDKFNDINCPEFQWNGPTLREVITDLMMVADCIPVVRNNVIDYINIGVTTGVAPTQGINYIQRSMSLENYVSELRMDMQNVMQTSIADINNAVSTVEYLSLISDSGIVTTQNMYLKTQFPILRIKKLWLYEYKPDFDNIYVQYSNNFKTVKVDITNYIKEAKEYQVLPILYKLSQFPSGGHYYDYQNFCLYFNRGTNSINGFDKTTKVNSLISTYTNVLTMLRQIAAGESVGIGSQSRVNYSKSGSDLGLFYSTFFKIEYETSADSVFSASKSVMPKHNRVIVDNQTNSWVDAWNQGFMEYQKANRLGNENLMLNQRCITETPVEIGQSYGDDNIIYQTTKQYYKFHTEVNAYATKHYILRNYFTGVQSKIRTWVNAQDEALIRHELYKTYCEFSFNNHNSTIEWKDIFVSPFKYFDMSPIKYVAIKTMDSTRTFREYILNCVTRVAGNSIILSCGFDDNYYAGKCLSEVIETTDIVANPTIDASGQQATFKATKLPQINSSSYDDYGGIPLDNLRYTDALGNFRRVYVDFSSGIEYSDLTSQDFIYQDGTIVTTLSDVKNSLFNFFQNPKTDKIDLNNIQVSRVDEVYKDNREIFKASYQFEYCTDNTNMYVGNEFVKHHQMVYADDNLAPIIYKSNTFVYGSEILPSDAVSTNWTLTNNGNEITINCGSEGSNKAIYITYNRKILLAIKTGTLTGNLKFYLNLKRNRLD